METFTSLSKQVAESRWDTIFDGDVKVMFVTFG